MQIENMKVTGVKNIRERKERPEKRRKEETFIL